ncbi:MAG: hypothetical protein U5K38_04385 [Woeseiaceae bacterium]|nr:hypothetical protein [Woeseiaceae bacterium]
MKRFGNIGRKLLLLPAAAILLQAAIPAGYMPAGAGSGLLFEFCPEGVSAEFMQILSGDGGHDHQHDRDDDHRCPVGHMLLSAAATDNHWQPDITPDGYAVAALPVYFFASVSRVNYEPRGPPA